MMIAATACRNRPGVPYCPVTREGDRKVKLEGSCHCGAVRFGFVSHTPHPYNLCYCSICRKTAGGGGYAINIMGVADTLEIEGEDAITVYRAADNERSHLEADGLSTARRSFCSKCGSALWVWDPSWPELIHPFASAIDTPLPRPPAKTVLMTRYAPGWVDIPEGPDISRFEVYPDRGIEDWHRAHGLYLDDD